MVSECVNEGVGVPETGGSGLEWINAELGLGLGLEPVLEPVLELEPAPELVPGSGLEPRASGIEEEAQHQTIGPQSSPALLKRLASELPTIRLLGREIRLSWCSPSEQRSLPRSRNDRLGRGAVSSHAGDAIREGTALEGSIIEREK